MEIAREMIAEAEEEEESSTEKLLAAAIAIMSGVTDSTSRSIITGKKGQANYMILLVKPF